MSWKLSWIQRWGLNHAVRQGKRDQRSAQLPDDVNILIVLPPEQEKILQQLPVLKSWVKKNASFPIFILVYPDQITVPQDFAQNVRWLSCHIDSLRKDGLPTKRFWRNFPKMYPTTILLFNENYHPFTETVFARLAAKNKVAVWHEKRQEYATILVKLTQNHQPPKMVELLLDYYETFTSPLHHTSNSML